MWLPAAVPSAQTIASVTTGAVVTVTLPAKTRRVKISNGGANALSIYPLLADANAANTNCVTIPATTGFLDLDPCYQQALYLLGSGGTTTNVGVLAFAEI